MMEDEVVITEQQVIEEQVQPEVVVEQKQTEQEQKEAAQQKNFRILRQENERFQRERDEAIKLAESYKKQQQPVIDDDDSFSLAPDDIAEGKHLSKVDKRIKELKNELQEYKQQANLSSTQSRIRAEFPDFYSVVTSENIQALKEVDPDMARVLETSNDLETVARMAYRAIKKDVIRKDDPYIDDKLRAHANASKPRPLASVSPQQGDSPLSKANAFANGLTEELKQQLFKEMMEAKRSM